jgi:hypothetical protein
MGISSDHGEGQSGEQHFHLADWDPTGRLPDSFAFPQGHHQPLEQRTHVARQVVFGGTGIHQDYHGQHEGIARKLEQVAGVLQVFVVLRQHPIQKGGGGIFSQVIGDKAPDARLVHLLGDDCGEAQFHVAGVIGEAAGDNHALRRIRAVQPFPKVGGFLRPRSAHLVQAIR